MFPYYVNVKFRYFGFVPVFRFRFGKSRHPWETEINNHYLHYRWGKQFNGVFLIARETSLISGSGFIPAFVVVVVIVVVVVCLFWHSSAAYKLIVLLCFFSLAAILMYRSKQ